MTKRRELAGRLQVGIARRPSSPNTSEGESADLSLLPARSLCCLSSPTLSGLSICYHLHLVSAEDTTGLVCSYLRKPQLVGLACNRAAAGAGMAARRRRALLPPRSKGPSAAEPATFAKTGASTFADAQARTRCLSSVESPYLDRLRLSSRPAHPSR